MADKYHINSRGEVSKCEATTRNCPIGGYHYESTEAAASGYESSMKNVGKMFNTKTKKSLKKKSLRKEEKIIQKISSANRKVVMKKTYKDKVSGGTVFQYSKRKMPVFVSEPHNPNAKQAVLSDVDGTLTKGSLVLDHAVYLHKNNIIDLGVLPDQWLADKKNEELITGLAEAYRDKIMGKTPEEIKVNEFIDDYIHKDENFYSTLKELKDYQSKGWEVRLISGSPSYLVEPFAEKYGFFAKGSEYQKDENGRFNGDIDGMFGYEHKSKYVEKLGLTRFNRILAYGDTGSDKALVDKADHATMVNPTEETMSKVKAHRIVCED